MVRATSSRPSGGGPRVPAAWTSPAWMVLWLLSIAALVTFARWDGISARRTPHAAGMTA